MQFAIHPKLCGDYVSTNFPHQQVRWKYDILCSSYSSQSYFIQSISGQCSHSMTPENSRKLLVFGYFQGVWNRNNTQKWVNWFLLKKRIFFFFYSSIAKNVQTTRNLIITSLLQSELMGTKKKKKLKANAIPTLFSHSKPKRNRESPKRCSEEAGAKKQVSKILQKLMNFSKNSNYNYYSFMLYTYITCMYNIMCVAPFGNICAI